MNRGRHQEIFLLRLNAFEEENLSFYMDLSCHFSNFFRFRFLFNVGDEKSFCTQLRPLNRHAKIIM